MPTVESADGMTHEFPEGTDQAVIDKAMKEYATLTSPQTPSTGSGLATNVEKDIQATQEGGMEFLRGVADVAGEPMRMATHLIPGAKTKQETSEGVVSGGKVPQKEPEQLTPARMAGSMLGAGGAGGAALKGVSAAAKLAPRAIASTLESGTTRAIGGGGFGGLMQPVKEGPDYWKEKGEAVETGMTLGYGLSVGGNVASAGLKGVGDFLARKYPEVVNNQAIAAILRRVQDGNKYGAPTAQQMLELTNAANKAGTPMAAIDVGGPGVKSLGGYLARRPETRDLVKSFLEKRDEGAFQRLEAAVAQHVSSGSTTFNTLRGLQQGRSAASRPLYEQTDQLQGIWSPRLEEFIKDPDVRKGMAMGYRLERLDSLAEGKAFDPTMLGVDLDANGEIQLLRKPNMRVLDMGKQGLDWMISDQRDPVTGRLSKLGVKLDAVRRKYIQELDALDKSGVYKKARETWSGYSASIDALKTGGSAFERSPEENAFMVSEMTPADQEFARIGLADKLRERLAKAGMNSDESLAIFKNRWTKGQLKPFFKSEDDYDQFVAKVTDENTMARTKNELIRGSQTAERVGEDVANSQAMQMAQTGYHIVKGAIHSPFSGYHYLSAAVDAYRLWRAVGLKPTPELNESMAKILFSETAPETSAARLLLKPPAQLPPTRMAQAGAKIQDVGAPVAASAIGGMERELPDQR